MPRVGTLRWGLSAMQVSVEYTLSVPARGPPDYETSGCASRFFLVQGPDFTTPNQAYLWARGSRWGGTRQTQGSGCASGVRGLGSTTQLEGYLDPAEGKYYIEEIDRRFLMLIDL